MSAPASKTKKSRKVVRRIPLDDPDLYLNQEMAWLAFNERVLHEAENKQTPLFERLKFNMIFNTNLDEFFMVRLSRLLRLWEQDQPATRTLMADDVDPEEMLDEVALKVRELVGRGSQCLTNSIFPALREKGIILTKVDDLTRFEEEQVDEYFERHVFPVLTPLALDPAHPFPYLSNLSLYLAVHFDEKDERGESLLAFVEVPQVINRFVPISSKSRGLKFMLLEDLIRKHLPRLFPWPKILSAHVFRVTRNLDYQLMEGEVKDLLKTMEYELKDRAQKIVVRLEIEPGTPDSLKARLRNALLLDPSDTYEVHGMMNLRDLSTLLKIDSDPKLRDPVFSSIVHPVLDNEDANIFDIIRERDVLLHHPYNSFVSVLDFLHSAADDPNVLAIKQTLYRTGGDSPVIEALVRAAENGKQVTAVVELKARFDEHNNIVWAKRLERAGVHVVFGFVNLKVHAKCALVVRKEGSQLQRFVHMSTGNYNPSTAKIYTDLSFFTSNPAITNDIVSLFNMITGFNFMGQNASLALLKRPSFQKIKVAPTEMREHFLRMIDNERRNHSDQNPGYIILKMNALIDKPMVQALYRASQAGVKVDLIIRGMCVLRPGVEGVSTNIRVISVIDRFLEHSRVYWFRNSGKPIVYLGSADFMPRNMDRRIEVAWPLENEELKNKVKEILDCYMVDNTKSHVMMFDGVYKQNHPGKDRAFRVQDKFILDAKRENAQVQKRKKKPMHGDGREDE